jgi:hypothetical protein
VRKSKALQRSLRRFEWQASRTKPEINLARRLPVRFKIIYTLKPLESFNAISCAGLGNHQAPNIFS